MFEFDVGCFTIPHDETRDPVFSNLHTGFCNLRGWCPLQWRDFLFSRRAIRCEPKRRSVPFDGRLTCPILTIFAGQHSKEALQQFFQAAFCPGPTIDATASMIHLPTFICAMAARTPTAGWRYGDVRRVSHWGESYRPAHSATQSALLLEGPPTQKGETLFQLSARDRKSVV